MKNSRALATLIISAGCLGLSTASIAQSGDGKVTISGELQQWHKVTLTLEGPHARETDSDPNPFTDYRMTVRFTHESGWPSHVIPGYFAADGDAANTSAAEGNRWRAHLSPDEAGVWKYEVRFGTGSLVAVDSRGLRPLEPYNGLEGEFTVAPTDKTGRDFRARGRLQYVGGHHLRFAGSGEYFL
ncbi:MAG: DUF5060 domain-containing protein, partial [Planctomycetes bacterium]|nr:DUF5060 domain-containing protein [Planctomycetota bacterium]